MGIYVLHESGLRGVADRVAADIHSTYNELQPVLIDANTPHRWGDSSWDDVLLVVFSSHPWPGEGGETIRTFRDAHPMRNAEDLDQAGGFVLPLSVDPNRNRPPDPISGLKSLPYNDTTAGSNGRMTRIVGAFLGLGLQPPDRKVFVSYRSADGSEIARDIHSRLAVAGFRPFLDDADERNIPPGSDVQEQIHQHLSTAAMVLLVDTPHAPESEWVREEIEYANAELIPILPVVAGGEDISRFLTMRLLRRRVPVKAGGIDGTPLDDGEWTQVSLHLEELLGEIYRRRISVASRTRAVFEQYRFDWKTLDEPKRMFRSQRDHGTMAYRVLSHCSVFDPQYLPTVEAFRDFVREYVGNSEINHRLFVYDRNEVLSHAEIRELRDETGDFCMFMHHSELEYLLPKICPDLG